MHGIQANAIGPGYMLTDMNQALVENPTFDAWVKGRTPARRWGKPEELVGAAVFLASAASDYVNGQIIYVDGGMIAANEVPLGERSDHAGSRHPCPEGPSHRRDRCARLGPGEVRVRIEAGGICGSDLHYYHHGGFGTVDCASR